MNKPFCDSAIGVFDSGIGGISVLSALKRRLPHESFIYLGDMARVPYGTKSKHTVIRYTIDAAQRLLEKNIKLLVIACNTATALALPEVQEAIGIPVIGVIEHSAKKACMVSKKGHIALIATEGTVSSGSYERVVTSVSPTIRVTGKSCGLFVSLAEEGFLDHPVTEQVAHEYLDPFFTQPDGPDCLILGCTHYPFLFNVIQRVIDNRMLIVDPAEETAIEVQKWLLNNHMSTTLPQPTPVEYLITDSKPRFQRLAQLFLNETIAPENITVFDW
jgi:glutamate racemase